MVEERKVIRRAASAEDEAAALYRDADVDEVRVLQDLEVVEHQRRGAEDLACAGQASQVGNLQRFSRQHGRGGSECHQRPSNAQHTPCRHVAKQVIHQG